MKTTDQLDVPENWETKEEHFNGNFKLIAEYINPQTGEKVRISPYKTYEGAGFCNAHTVEYWPDDSTWETVAKGLKHAEHPEEAKQKAITKMKGLN